MRPFKPETLTYFYLSRPAPCPYLPGRMEQMVFTELATSGAPSELHDRLSRAGFRRSQSIAYKPSCLGCNACVPVRIRAADFRPGRSFRRILNRNENIRGHTVPPVALSGHYDLFRRYVESRHADGGMAAMTFDDYVAMIQDTPISSRVIEFRDADGTLYGVCLTDLLDDGLSLVYSFFDPEYAAFSPGTFIILWHITYARELNLPYVYLGYWIEASPKMSYKTRFEPVEALGRDGWREIKR